MLQQNPKKPIRPLVVCCVASLLLLVALILGRGWVRGQAIPAYVNAFYESGISRQFDHDFPEVTERLNSLSFSFDSSVNKHDYCNSGENVEYSGIGEEVDCQRRIISDEHVPTSNFIANWRQNSDQLEQYLLTNGWHKEWNAQQPISQIYDNPNNHLSVGVNYTKPHGKITCSLSIRYNAKQPDSLKTFATESCSRAVSFFGGTR